LCQLKSHITPADGDVFHWLAEAVMGEILVESLLPTMLVVEFFGLESLAIMSTL
jgi:hypothetical protein